VGVKGKIKNALERKLYVQRKYAKEAGAKDAATIKVKLEAMAELNNSVEKDKTLLLCERDLVSKENDSLRCESECVMKECLRLHDIQEEAKLLRVKCTGMEGRFEEVSVMVKELGTERNRYKAIWEECGSLQYQVSCLQVSLKKKANEEKDVLERHVKGLESKIPDHKNSIKDLKQRSCMDTEENKKSEQREGRKGKRRKLALMCHIRNWRRLKEPRSNLDRWRHPASLKTNR
jgi:hypothetical protein